MTVRPVDWPIDGRVDLTVHDLPHHSSTTEWWYINSHLETTTGRKFSLFASFFRLVTGKNRQTQQPEYAHSVTWALSDLDDKQYHAASCIDPRAPEIILEELNRGGFDTLTGRAMREVVSRGNLPRPDRLIQAPITINLERLNLDYGGDCFSKDDNGVYHLDLFNAEANIGCSLTFRPLKQPVRHGDNGVVRGVSNEGMFYYFVPRCAVEGTLIIDGAHETVKTASGWYDHEFGQKSLTQTDPAPAEDDNIAWNWISVQLDNGWELSAYDLFDTERSETAGRWAILIDPAGTPHHYDEFTFEPLDSWTSIRTFNSYPTLWRLDISGADVHLTVKATFAEQEFITLISKPAFWEGHVQVGGRMRGHRVSGPGYVERSGFGQADKITDFLAAVGSQTQKCVQELLPLEPAHADALRLVGGERNPHYLDGLDIDQFTSTVIKPIREIIDRGGKAWRSYALLACCEVVGGDSFRLTNWLAMPELLHVGSLIVDDVQDKSEIRRGGPACHTIYGEPLAINAGTAAYFLGQILMSTAHLTQTEQLRVYEVYFETLRSTHVGQAIDLDGLHSLMPQVVESGESAHLEKRILAIHRLKSAVPARSLAMIGAILGGGTEQQIRALGDFFEALGLAFQIVDDTLNLRGFKGDLKLKGEDLAQGKVTMPVAKAMSRLPLAERRAVWKTISEKPTDPLVIGEIIRTFDACCALRSCEEHARDLVETAWAKLDPVIEDSHVKVKLRAFGWYVLDRHY